MFWSRSRRYGYRRWRRYGRSRSARRASGNMRAARQQRDTANVVVNKISSVSFNLEEESEGSPTRTNSAAILLWPQLKESEYFINYAGMFDQVRINKVRVKVTGQNTSNTNISPTVLLAFDRNGLDYGATQIPLFNRLSTYSSANVRQWSTGNSFIIYQTIYPTTMGEKSQYIPTSSLLSDKAAGVTPILYGNTTYASNGVSTLGDPSDIMSPIASPSIPFKPLAYISALLTNVITATDGTTLHYGCSFLVELSFSLTFRGMRKPGLDITGIQGAASDYNTVLTMIGVPGREATYLDNFTYQPEFLSKDLGVNDSFVNIIPQTDSTIVRVIGNFGSTQVQAPLAANSYWAVFSGVTPQTTYNIMGLGGVSWSTLAYSGAEGVQTSAVSLGRSLFTFDFGPE